MKRFVFRHHRILKLKKQFQRIAEMRSQQSNQRLVLQSQRIKRIETDLINVADQLTTNDQPICDKRTIQNLGQLKEYLSIERSRYVELEAIHRSNVETLTRQNRDIDVLLSLRKTAHREYRAESTKHQQLQLDEFTQFKDSARRRILKTECDHV